MTDLISGIEAAAQRAGIKAGEIAKTNPPPLERKREVLYTDQPSIDLTQIRYHLGGDIGKVYAKTEGKSALAFVDQESIVATSLEPNSGTAGEYDSNDPSGENHRKALLAHYDGMMMGVEIGKTTEGIQQFIAEIDENTDREMGLKLAAAVGDSQLLPDVVEGIFAGVALSVHDINPDTCESLINIAFMDAQLIAQQAHGDVDKANSAVRRAIIAQDLMERATRLLKLTKKGGAYLGPDNKQDIFYRNLIHKNVKGIVDEAFPGAIDQSKPESLTQQQTQLIQAQRVAAFQRK